MNKIHSYSENLKELIQKFENTSVDLGTDVLKENLRKLLKGYACLTRKMESSYAFRARINSGNKLFKEVKDLWYPPKELIRKPGRLNREGQPIFYVSAFHDIATLEVQPKIGDCVTILRLKLKDAKRLPHVMELGVAETQSQYNLSRSFQILENTTMRNIFNDESEIRNNSLIRSFIAKLLMQIVKKGNKAHYRKTVALSEILMCSSEIDGVLYPSIAGDGSRKGGGMNGFKT